MIEASVIDLVAVGLFIWNGTFSTRGPLAFQGESSEDPLTLNDWMRTPMKVP